MSGLNTVWIGNVPHTTCTECGRRLESSDEWRECKRRHTLEWWWQNDPKLMQMVVAVHTKGNAP